MLPEELRVSLGTTGRPQGTRSKDNNKRIENKGSKRMKQRAEKKRGDHKVKSYRTTKK